MLTAERISKIYQLSKGNDTTALAETTLTFPDRGLVAITGKSGCGKTTLLNVLSGVDQPTTGEVRFSGEGSYASFIFQDAQLIDDFTVEENLRLIRRILPDTDENFDALLTRFGLGEVRTHKSNQLSAGQKQRVAIVRAILQNRPVLFADEPTGNLDEKTSGEIAAALAEQAKERLVIVVTHDYEYFAPYASRKIVMSDGKIVSDETLTEDRDSAPKTNLSSARLTWTTAARFAVKGLKKALPRFVLSAVSLFLSLLLALSGFNILLNDEGTVHYKAFRDAGLMTADFGKIGRYEGYNSVSDYEAQDLANQFSAVEYDAGSIAPADKPGAEILVSRAYLSDRSIFPVRYGEAEIGDHDIVISDYVAAALAGDDEIASVLGSQVFFHDSPLTVTGIYETGYQAITEAQKENFPSINSHYITCVLRKSAYREATLTMMKSAYAGVNTYPALVDMGGKIGSIRVIAPKQDYDVIAGNSYRNLQDDELFVSREIAEALVGETVGDAVGKSFTLRFRRIYHSFLSDPTGRDGVEYEETRTYRIAGVYRGHEPGLIVNDKNFEEIYFGFSLQRPMYGISLPCYTKTQVREMFRRGFGDATYLSGTIDEGKAWLSTLSLVELGLAVVLLIISVITLVNYVLASMARSKREMGVLMSFGVKKKSLPKIFLVEAAGIALGAMFLAFLLEFAVIAIFNHLLISTKITLIKYLYYEPLSLLVILGIMALLMVGITAAVLLSFRKKSPIDVIYER